MVLEPRGLMKQDQSAPRKRAVPQWNLRTLLLLTAAVAVWIGSVRYQLQNWHLRSRVESMHNMAGDLRVDDPQQIAIIRLPQTWYDEQRWHVHLPDGRYVMRLATRGIIGTGLPVAREETSLSPGRHRIELLQSKDKEAPELAVLVDEQAVMETTETSDWDPHHGAMGGENFDICTQRSPEKPVILFRRRFDQLQKDGSYSTRNATNGILLWIERVSH